MESDRTTKRPPAWLVIAAFATIYGVWGSTYLAIRIGVETIPPFLMTAARFTVAGAILFVFARRADRTPLEWRQVRSAAIAGTLMLFGGTGLVSLAETTVPSALAALLVSTVPLWLVMLDWQIFRGVRPTPSITLGLLGGLAGVFLLVGPGDILGKAADPAGSALILVACICWSSGTLFARKAVLPSSPYVASSLKMLCAGVVMLVAAAARGEWSALDLSAVSARSAWALAYLTFAGSILAFTAYSWLLRVTTPAKLGTYAYVNPVVAMVLGVTIGNEVLPPRAWIASVIIISAVALITVTRGRTKPRSTPAQRPVSETSPRALPAGDVPTADILAADQVRFGSHCTEDCKRVGA
ncbi:MAG: EamA family transporter [Planctomycetota bacterium]|jgi:drug/metabolite transporter (DMT)-like permease